MTSYPMSQRIQGVLATVADARDGISGRSVAAWLNCSSYPEGVRESLRALVARGLIDMRRMEDREYPDYLAARYYLADQRKEPA